MSTVGYGPLQRIDGPPPLAPIYGLTQAAQQPAAGVRIVVDTEQGPLDEAVARAIADFDITQPGRERWIGGVEVYPYPPGLADVFNPCAEGSEATEKGFGEELEHPQFGAMTVWFAETCTTSKIPSQEEFKGRAVAAFTAVQGAAIAHEFLTGERMPLNPHLSDGNGDFPNGDTATSVVNGLAMLEDEIARSGRQGLIHVSPGIATAMRDRFTIDNKTGVVRTINGIVVLPDFGYVDGATPHGHAAATGTQEWMYASGPVDIRWSEIFTMPETVEEALDRGLGATNGKPNAITYRAERYVLVDWDTEMQAAVLVDRCLTTCE